MDVNARRALLDEYFEAVNAHDPERVTALFAADGEASSPGSGGPQRGHEQLLAYFSRMFEPFAEHRDQPTEFEFSEHGATVRIAVTARLSLGTELEFDAVDLFRFSADGKLAAVSTWYDSLAVHRAATGRPQ